MLENIKDYLRLVLVEERLNIFIQSIELILNYNIITPVERIREFIVLSDINGNEETLYIIESIISDTLQQIISNHYILTNSDLVFRFELLKSLELLEHYIDSDVIVKLHNDFIEAKEMLLVYLQLVSNKPIEYFDENIIDVRNKLISNLYDKHEKRLTDEIEEGIQNNPNLEMQRSFASLYPLSMGVRLVTMGKIKLNMKRSLLISKFRQNIYDLEDPKDIAIAIFSLVVISDTKPSEYQTIAMQIVNDLYNDLHLVGELKYLVTSFKLPEVENNNVNS